MRNSIHRRRLNLAAVNLAAALLVSGPALAATRQPAGDNCAGDTAIRCSLYSPRIAQDGDSAITGEIGPDQIEKYVAVYKVMQHNRSLTVEQAAGQQGLTLGQFRALEQKIEHNNVARQRARDELQSAVSASPAVSPDAK